MPQTSGRIKSNAPRASDRLYRCKNLRTRPKGEPVEPDRRLSGHKPPFERSLAAIVLRRRILHQTPQWYDVCEICQIQRMKRARYRSEPTEDIELFWQLADNLSVQASQAVYMFRKERGREILYIGKAFRQSIKQRWVCRSKARLGKLARKERITLRPLVAGFHTKLRLTPHLVDDVERLLIFMTQPRWNRPGMKSCSLHHRRLTVKCTGQWPYPRSIFTYLNDLPRSFELTAR